MPIKNKKIIVGITGGIAAYKIPTLIRLLKKAGAEVHAIMTESATKFITELTIETVTQFPVAREMFPNNRYAGTHHIDLAEWADLFIVAPATANTIGKVSAGICDDLLSTVICATKTPVVFVPAMNTNMYLNPVTRNNLDYLQSVGYKVMTPETGEMACETSGIGRMPEPEQIYDYVDKFFSSKKLSTSKKKILENRKVVITAGPCREPIDPVRYISNRSSGKMGYALAQAAIDAGADVTLISGPSYLVAPTDLKFIGVETTDEMFKAAKKEFHKADYLIMSAAPADFKPAKMTKKKIKKDSGLRNLELIGTVDILSELGKSKKSNQRLIGFALETDNGLANARKKLKAKNLDMIVLNSVGEKTPFDSDTNTVTVIKKSGKPVELNEAPKQIISDKLVEIIAKL